jgi:hypothetical protein
MKLEFSQQIVEKKSRISNFIKIRSVGTELFHADKATDATTDERAEANSRISKLFESA